MEITRIIEMMISLFLNLSSPAWMRIFDITRRILSTQMSPPYRVLYGLRTIRCDKLLADERLEDLL